MNQQLLKDYARLVAQKGAHVVKGDEVWVYAGLDQPEFVTMVVEELYKGGAAKVVVEWNLPATNKLAYKYQSLSTLSKVPPYALAKWKYRLKKLPTTIYIESDDPDALKGINQAKASKARMKTYPKIKPFRDAMEGKYKWTIVAVPGVAWAKKVFPGIDENEAVEKLWDAILSCARVDGNDPVKNWDDHNSFLQNQCKKLNDLGLKELIYKSSNGTDFRVGLIPNMKFCGGLEVSPVKGEFNPNIPSEECFTSPMSGVAEGTLVATKPLSYNGELIEDFQITFKGGKAVEVKAKKGQKLLEQMISMDEGACKLGEVALVPYNSPINNTGILFYNTLFDENACCHCALGFGFPDCYPNGVEMPHDEIVKIGVNDSMIHVDFMIGSPDLSIVGVDKNGKKVQIFKDGGWAI